MAAASERPALSASFSPQVRALFESLPPFPSWSTLTPAEIRSLPTILAAAPEPVASVVQRGIRVAWGWLRIRVYSPTGGGPHPCLVWQHGGSWIWGSLDGADRTCRAITARASCVVVSVDYRLAPETKFPGGFEDAYAAFGWVASAAASLGIDARRIAVGGDSAGGNLAAAVTLATRDRGGPSVAFQLLVYPVTDVRMDSAAFTEFGNEPPLTRRDLEWCAEQYLGPNWRATDQPYVTVLRAPDLRGLAPALIVTAGCDPLRDQGEAYAARLRDAGVETVIRRYEGMPHGFLGFPSLDDSGRALDEISAELKRRLGA